MSTLLVAPSRIKSPDCVVIVFPSMMHHRVHPVLSGERRVLVAWAWGPLYK